jgi:hypothetical protein
LSSGIQTGAGIEYGHHFDIGPHPIVPPPIHQRRTSGSFEILEIQPRAPGLLATVRFPCYLGLLPYGDGSKEIEILSKCERMRETWNVGNE